MVLACVGIQFTLYSLRGVKERVLVGLAGRLAASRRREVTALAPKETPGGGAAISSPVAQPRSSRRCVRVIPAFVKEQSRIASRCIALELRGCTRVCSTLKDMGRRCDKCAVWPPTRHTLGSMHADS